MRKLAAVFVTVTLLLNAMAPALVYAATYLQGAEVNANTLVRDAYVAVTYYHSKGKQELEKGWIDAIDETTFQIRIRAFFGKKIIAYDKVLSVIMSEDSTTPVKQINEVDRFMRKREIEQAKQERVQAAIHRFNKYDAKVRVQAPSIQKRRISGRLIKMTQDTLVIQRGHTFFQVPVSSISNFEVSIGRYRNTNRGIAIGVGLGFAIIAPSVLREDPEWRGLAFLVYGGTISLPICIVSTLIGAMIKSDKWVEVPPDRLNLSLAPTSTKGLRAALTFNF